jgi:hypothetical protein
VRDVDGGDVFGFFEKAAEEKTPDGVRSHMPLKLTATDLDEIPEAQRGLYRARSDGAGFILDVEGGVVPKATHDEFRQRNVELMKRMRDISDIDPEEIATLRADNRQLRVELDKASKGAAAATEGRVKALETARDQLRQKLESVLIDGEISKVAASLGAHPGAIDDIATRVRPQFKLGDDGQAVALDRDGGKIYGEDGHPLGIAGAVRLLIPKAPHLFRQSTGGGAAHAGAGGDRATHGQANPFKRETLNVTEQARIMKTDRAEAARLAAEAGVTLPT